MSASAFRIRVRQLREEAGLSQVEFAAKLKAGQSTVAGWEAATKEPNYNRLIEIADFFGVSTDYLLGRTDERTGHIIEKPAELADLGVMSVEKFGSDALTEQEIAAIRKMLAEQNKQG